MNAFRPLFQRPHDYCPNNCYWYQKSFPRGSTPRCFNCGSTCHRVHDRDVTPAKILRKHEKNDRHDSRERRSSVSRYRRNRHDSPSERHVEFSINDFVTSRSDDEYCVEKQFNGFRDCDCFSRLRIERQRDKQLCFRDRRCSALCFLQHRTTSCLFQ